MSNPTPSNPAKPQNAAKSENAATPENAASAESAAKLQAQIKQTWGKLNDEDIKLYEGKPDQFFAKLKEKQNVSKEDGQKKMQELEKACGCGPATKAA